MSPGRNNIPENEAPVCRACNPRWKAFSRSARWCRWLLQRLGLGRFARTTEDYIKVRFLLDPADWHAATAERVWAEPIWAGGRKVFRLMNHPFYMHGVSFLDVVDAVRAPDGLGLDYAATIERSGHSNIWLMVVSPPPSAFEDLWSALQKLNCSYESTSMDTEDGRRQTLYAVDVPAGTDITRVLSIAEQGQTEDVWIYQIGHLAHERTGGARGGLK